MEQKEREQKAEFENIAEWFNERSAVQVTAADVQLIAEALDRRPNILEQLAEELKIDGVEITAEELNHYMF